MQDLGINPVDIVVLVIVVLSGALAFVRGFVKEVLAVVGWVGAAIATLQLFPYVRPITRQYIQTEMLADGLAGLGIFLITLLLFSILSHSIAKGVRNSAISAVDRSLGFLFGLVRGAVVVCLAYLLVVSVLAPKDQPAWLRNARVMPLLEWGTSRIILLVPNEYRPNVDLGANAADIQARPPTALP
ncbi:MAG: CvpA family protein, partial [Ferrovibrionaceae bacterium]